MDTKVLFLECFVWLTIQILRFRLHIMDMKNLFSRRFQTMSINFFQNFLSSHTEKVSSLPRKSIGLPIDLCKYKDFWFFPVHLEGVMSGQQLLAARPPDIILCSTPKTGTTWLKALSYAITTRNTFHPDSPDHPLRNKSPHECIPFLEFDLVRVMKSWYPFNGTRIGQLCPIVATHMPCCLLPESVFKTSCKIVYIWRDPKDAFVSSWNFLVSLAKDYGVDPNTFPLDDVFDLYCRGISNCGSYWDHVIGFLKASQKSPDKVLCLKYEDMMQEPSHHVKKLAKFISHSFSNEEEENGVVEKIVNLCSFNHLRNLEVNKNGKYSRFKGLVVIKNSGFFRKGQVGDWRNHLSHDMAARLERIFEQKFAESGLRFRV